MNKLLIRAEDKNKWERRAPLVPEDIAGLRTTIDFDLLVESSAKRCLKEKAYTDVDAQICHGMQDGDVILGIKEIPAEKILPKKTYLFFSHTIKGQSANMPLLQKIMDAGATLIDYEKIVDKKHRRLIYFGPFAGHAGAIDLLSLMGENWADQCLFNPFSNIQRAHQYPSVAGAQNHLEKVADIIKKDGFPETLCPLTISILGYGNVSRGAQEILNTLPVKEIPPQEMSTFIEKGNFDQHTIYTTIFKEEDLVRPKAPSTAFNLQEYFDFPERYEADFERFLPYYTLLINAVYWEPRYPRFVTWEGLRRISEKQNPIKLGGIGDISCDTNGAMACNVKSTDSDDPAYRVDPQTRKVKKGHLGEGIVVLAVDNLPCELPKDSSSFFSHQLAPFIPNLLQSDFSRPFENCGLCPELSHATIVYNGELTLSYQYLNRYL